MHNSVGPREDCPGLASELLNLYTIKPVNHQHDPATKVTQEKRTHGTGTGVVCALAFEYGFTPGSDTQTV